MKARQLVFIGTMLLMGLMVQSCGGDKQEEKDLQKTILVKVDEAHLAPYVQQYSFSGKVEAQRHSNLSTRIMGQVSRVLVDPGTSVKAGDLLLQIRSKDITAKKAQVKANMVEASAAYNNAKKDYERYGILFDQKSVSQKEMDDVTMRYDMSKARLAAVKEMNSEVEEMLQYANIRAPYDGIITKKFVDEGDMANPGMPLLGMEQSKGFRVLARIPESDISKVNKGDRVSVLIKAIGDMVVLGMITEVNPSTLGTGSQYEAKIDLRPSKEQLGSIYSGMYATVLMSKGEEKSVMVPRKVLIQRGQLTGLYAVSQSGTALLRWVRTGKSKGEMVEILSGLADGEKYIVSWEGKISDGVRVRVE